MLAGVVTRDHGTPWPDQGLNTAAWKQLPVAEFLICELVVTQPGVHFGPLINPTPASFTGDPYPHVVVWQGIPYLEDGHHRLVRAMLAGLKTLWARRLEVDNHPEEKR